MKKCQKPTLDAPGEPMEKEFVIRASSLFSHYGLVIRHFPLVVCLALAVLTTATATAQNTEIQMLSGHGKDDAEPWKFLCTSGAHSGVWTNLPVPSQWDVKGFGHLTYHKDATNAYDEHGLYEHEFPVAEAWRGKRIFLVFDGSMTDTAAKLNGQSVGPVHQGSFYRFKYEVTSLVKFGATNKLEVDVAKHSANKSVNDAERLADYWVFGGLFRPVYLEAVPQEFIERVAIDARADGTFSAQVFLSGLTNGAEVEAQIQTLNGKTIGKLISKRAANNPLAPIGGEGQGEGAGGRTENAPSPQPSPPGEEREPGVRVQLAGGLNSPKLWTAETPNLYRAEFRLKQNGKVIHTVTQRFGFRTMEVRDGDGFYVNGQKIILKGVDRHSFWPDSGRCLSEAVHRLDINLMKDANMNAVRMSHYPPDEQFLDLCDELGLYVLDELAGWHHFYDNDIGPKLVKEMVARDVNHPSILFWDNGNEGGFNTSLDKLFGEYDPQNRRVLHPWAAFSGVNTAHYLAYDKAEIAAFGQKVAYSKNQELVFTNDRAKYIYMPTEFLHGLYDGGAGAGLDDYWRMMTASKTLGGGFIWTWTDDGVKRPDTGEIDVAGNQAPDGIVGPYREREGSYFTIKEIWSPIQITREKFNAFTVENHYAFTDTRDCKFIWQYRKNARLAGTNSGFTVIRQNVIKSPAVAPGGKAGWKFAPEPSTASFQFDAEALRVEDPHGREVWTWVWPRKTNPDFEALQEPALHHATAVQTNGAITVTVGDLTATFSGQSGFLSGVQRGGQTFSLTNGPRLAVGHATLRELHFSEDGPDVVVAATYDGDLESVIWRVNGNGWLNCRYTYAAHGTNDFLGVLFDYPETLVTHKRWLGDGPFRVWKNRLRGVTSSVWENDYNDTLTGLRGWVYPEFKGFFANWRWLQLTTREGEITVMNESNVPFVQVLTPGFAPDNLKANAIAPVPVCGLGLLDAISPIGSKFKEARFGGPQGQPNQLSGEFSGVVSFYFGKLP